MKGYKILAMAMLANMANTAFSQENVFPLMRELPQCVDYNPSFTPSGGGYFNCFLLLGGTSFGFSNSGFRYTDMYTRTADDSLHLYFDKLYANMKDISLASVDFSLPLAQVGIPCRRGGGFLSFGAGIKSRLDVSFHKSLLDFRKGNYDFDENRIHDCTVRDIFVRGEVYEEFSVGYSRRFGRRVRLGARLKFLAGMMSVYADNLSLSLSTEVDGEGRGSIVLQNTGHLQVTAPLALEPDADGYVDELKLKENLSLSDFNIFKNRGLAMDFGAEFRLGDSTKLGIAVTDVGYIRWRNHPNQFDVKNTRRFYGIDISGHVRADAEGWEPESEGDTYWDGLSDSIRSMAHMKADTSVFTTKMSSRLVASLEIPVRRWLTIGSTFSGEFVNKHYYTHASVGLVMRAPKVFSSIVSFSLNPGVRPSLGGGVVLTGRAFQAYMLAERVPVKLSTMTGAHLSMGINFVLGHRKDAEDTYQDKPEPAVVVPEPAVVVPEPIVVVPEDAIIKKKNMKKNQKKKKGYVPPKRPI